MTISEFSNGFDTMLNSHDIQVLFGEESSRLDIVLDEYEKSLYLTLAQEDLVKELYSNKYTGEGFETSEEIRRSLSTLVSEKTYTAEDSDDTGIINKLLDNFTHTIYELPEDCWYIVYEHGQYSSDNKCLDGTIGDIIPVTHDEYYRTILNPFRGPNRRRILRLDSGDQCVELVSSIAIGKYTVRYLRKPSPIILVSLSESNLSIDGIDTESECELPELLHREILDRAVKLAIMHKTNSSKNNVSAS